MTSLMIILSLIVPTSQKAIQGPLKRSCDFRCRAVAPYNAKLDRMAQCESSGHWFINTGNGFYGGLQFMLSTWQAVGGRGYPHQNSILEQKYRAVRLIRVSGYRPWPICGYA